MTDDTADHLRDSLELIASARSKREALLRQIEDSQRTIARSRELIARIDELLAQLESDQQ